MSASWDVPADAVSGIYIAKLVRDDGTPGASHIVVRRARRRQPLRRSVPDLRHDLAGLQHYGGNSLYVGGPGADRPRLQGQLQPAVHHARHRRRGLRLQRRVPDGPLARSATATTSATSPASTATARGSLIQNHKTSSVGRPRRVLVGPAARQRRGGARRRRQPRLLQRQRGLLEDPLGEQHRRLRHRLPHAGLLQGDPRNAKIDPDRAPGPGTWRDPRFSPPADGGRPENALTGTIFMVNVAAPRRSRSRRPTASCASGATPRSPRQPPGQTATLAADTLGYEWDEDLDNGFGPPGLIDLSSTTRRRSPQLPAGLRLDLRRRHGHAQPDAVPGAERRARLRRRHHPVVVGPRRRARPRQPARRRPAHAAGDGQPARRHGRAARHAAVRAWPRRRSRPTPPRRRSTHHLPGRGRHRSRRAATVTITGTATDAGGGVVGGVEVSVDGGTPGTRPPAARTGATRWIAQRRPATSPCACGRSTTAATSARRRR